MSDDGDVQQGGGGDLTVAQKMIAILVLNEGKGFYVSDDNLRRTLEGSDVQLPAGEPEPGKTGVLTFFDGSRLLLTRNAVDWHVEPGKTDPPS